MQASKPVDVMNLATGKTLTYVGISPRDAVIAAFAQASGDYNTWDYGKYAPQVRESSLCVTAGNFSAFQNGRRIERAKS